MTDVTEGPVRVVIVDDHEIVRSGLRAVLTPEAGFEVVGEAASGDGALGAVETHQPDVVIMDLHMPGMNGIEATRRITAEGAATPAVLVLTMFDDDESLQDALRAGARGYLLKGAGRDEVRSAVRGVARGGAVFGAGIAAAVLEHMARPAQADAAFPDLTARERSVLELMVAGLHPPAIARRLGVADKTVRNSMSSILTKLGVETRADAVARARRAGLRAD